MYDVEAGYDRVTRDPGGSDVFVHSSALGHGTRLSRGDRVRLRVITGSDRDVASRVVVAD